MCSSLQHFRRLWQLYFSPLVGAWLACAEHVSACSKPLSAFALYFLPLYGAYRHWQKCANHFLHSDGEPH